MRSGTNVTATGWQERVANWLLGADFQQRRRLLMVLTTALVYGVCLLLVVYGVYFDIFPLAGVAPVAALLALTPVIFFIVIRAGLNLHFAEPSLAFPQALCAQTFLAMAYGAVGPVHPGILMFLTMVMLFGMFDMGPRKVRLVMLYTLCLMSVVMAWSSYRDPVGYPPEYEVFYFAVMCTLLPTITSLSLQLAKMRDRLRTQKGELEQALEQIQKVATHDELTGLANRRHMIALLGEHIERRARGGPGFSVALADIDHFKNVNDTFGHRVGDEALSTFALQARAQLRSTDIIARWGGEEFLLLLPETNPPGDPNVGVERLRGALAVARASEHAPHLRIAFSTGLTRYIDGEAIDDMIERADRALYRAKSSGRNRTATE